MIDLSTLTLNKDNPRDIEEGKFEKLCNSIARDPKFLELRPIIVDSDNIIIAGNMRFRALHALEFKSIPDEWVTRADKLTEEERRRFVVIDNLSYGFTDWDILTSFYQEEELIEWGMDIPMDPIDEDEEVPPESHGFRIQCEDLEQLIELRELLEATENSKSMGYDKFKLIFKNRS